MKSTLVSNSASIFRSPPSRGAWIEIREKTATALYRLSPPSRGAWIEIRHRRRYGGAVGSPPSRGAWIEISTILIKVADSCGVAPLAGGVD